MSHADLVTVILSIHGPILLGTLAAYYKYGDRTEIFTRSLQGTDDLLRKMRESLAALLEQRLDPVFRNPGSVPSPIIDPHGDTYIERPINPVGSEQYREALRDFVDAEATRIVDYRSAYEAGMQWCKWSKRLSWALLFFWIYQGAAAGIVIVFDVACSIKIPEFFLLGSIAPTGLLFVFVAVAASMCQWHHTKICDLRLEHGKS